MVTNPNSPAIIIRIQTIPLWITDNNPIPTILYGANLNPEINSNYIDHYSIVKYIYDMYKTL